VCGIAGILSTHLDPELVSERISVMKQAIRHRGPDGEGIYLSDNAPIALAHTRLSILDLSPSGHQPMATSNGRYWITFNGEIYNFGELRAQLEGEGEAFSSGTDTEVLLRLYQRYGKTCLDKLRGMFAFAIWDQQEQSCFIARDQMGIKPLYYWQSGSHLVFASELRSVMASGFPDRQLSPQGLYGYFVSGSVPEPYTLVKNVFCLPAGTWLYWQGGRLMQQHYWTIRFGEDASCVVDARDRVRQAVMNSIKAHYTSDVPVGIFLSGGIDSTAIVALSRQVYQGSLHTYSIALEDPDRNEGDLARQLAQKFDTHHVEHLLTAEEGRRLFPKFLDALDQPSIDGFNSFCVSKVAHDHGQKVVLSGLGGDELFAGYKSFEKLPQMLEWGRWAKRLNPVSKKFAAYLSKSGPSSKWRRIGDYFQQPSSLPAAYQSFRGIFSHREAILLLEQYLPDTDLSASLYLFPVVNQPSLADNISELELSCYMRNQLLRDSDVMSMSWGLELRVPFVDRILLEEISDIPAVQRLAYSKQILVEAVPEVPGWIVNRPKRGFRFPFDHWFSNSWSDLAGEVSCPNAISLDPWYRLWSLIVLQHWLQEVLT
jgi:asparagine synthase (glutamine-hydrolysing)